MDSRKSIASILGTFDGPKRAATPVCRGARRVGSINRLRGGPEMNRKRNLLIGTSLLALIVACGVGQSAVDNAGAETRP